MIPVFFYILFYIVKSAAVERYIRKPNDDGHIKLVVGGNTYRFKSSSIVKVYLIRYRPNCNVD